jgi:hypothetical protein
MCGTVQATGFLVSNDMIVTNWHVVRDIEDARKSSTPFDHSEVRVYFHHEENGVPLFNGNGHMLKPLSYEGNVICDQLDYSFLFLEECVEGILVLGDRVIGKVPEQGKVCVVGHPRGETKQEELGLILPLHNGRRLVELQKRYNENEVNCRINPSGCAMANEGKATQICVHSLEQQTYLQKLATSESVITYDVGSMFEGSSGGPVFDMKGNIVALHTGGFRTPISSIVEYGVTFKKIIANLKESGRSQFVREHFSSCDGIEPMRMLVD